MLQSFSKFEVMSKMVRKACAPVNPTIEKSLAKNRENMDMIYQELYHDFKLFKADVNDPEFNEKLEDGTDKHEYNDTWFEKITSEYYELIETSDDKLESLTANEPPSKTPENPEVKVASELKIRTLLEDQLKAEKKSISDSIDNASDTITNMQSIGVAQGQAIRGSLHDISIRIDVNLQKLFEQLLQFLNDSDTKQIQSEYFEFISTQRARVDSIEMAIVAKTKDVTTTTASRHDTSQTAASRTYLKKVEPSNFSGDILDFPEFKRKWAANVSREKLEEESELDRLRDNVPETARKMLIGEKSLENAWKILTT